MDDASSSCLTEIKNEFHWKNFCLYNSDDRKFLYLQWSSSRKLHVSYRAALFLYCGIWLAIDLANHDCDSNYFYYLSNWAQFISVAYLGVSFLFTVKPRLKGLQSIVWGIFNVYVTIAIGICFVSFVGQDQVYSTTRTCPVSFTIHVHVIIAIFALCEVIVTRIPVKLLHFYMPMIFAVVYIVFTVLLHHSGTISNIYPEHLDWAAAPRQAAEFSLFLLFLGCPGVHLFVYCVYKVRILIFRKVSRARINRSSSLHTISGSLLSNRAAIA